MCYWLPCFGWSSWIYFGHNRSVSCHFMVWMQSGAPTWLEKRSTMLLTQVTAPPRLHPDGATPAWLTFRTRSGRSCRAPTSYPITRSSGTIRLTPVSSRVSFAGRSSSGGYGKMKATWPFSHPSPTLPASPCWFHGDLWPPIYSDCKKGNMRLWCWLAGRCHCFWRRDSAPGGWGLFLKASKSTTLTPSWYRCFHLHHLVQKATLPDPPPLSSTPLTPVMSLQRMDPRPAWIRSRCFMPKWLKLNLPV